MEAKKAVVTEQPRGEVKAKNKAPAQGKNRRVLSDIGNLEILQGVEGKITRPITRGYHAQLLANAQAAPKNDKLLAVDKGIRDARKGKNVKKAGEAQKKLPAADQERNNAKLERSSDEEQKVVKEVEPRKKKSEKADSIGDEKGKAFGGRSFKEMSLRKEVKTFTSVLNARSKAACGISRKSKDLIVNIDAADINNEFAEVEYVDDIYTFYKLTEDDSRVQDYMLSQPHILPRMRTILVDWLVEVHSRFELMPESLYLTINIVDRYLSMKNVTRRELQLVGISSMLIACKYEEIWAPLVNDLVCISDYTYGGEEVRVMEKAILGKLGWYLTVPTPYVFLVRYIKASLPPDHEMDHMTFFLAELGLLDYSTTIHYPPSLLAAASVYAARCTLKKSPPWNETLKHHTGYSEEKLMDCAKLLVSFHLAATKSEKKVWVYKKFSSMNREAVALFPPAKALLGI